MPNPLTLTSLPLFPLNTVLFPGGQLPLRVFEVRYLDMVRKCHQAGTPFGVVALTGGEEVRRPMQATESFHPVGTLAQIQQLDSVQPGLLHILCQGHARMRLDRAHQLPHGLWVADVSLIAMDLRCGVPEDLRSISQALSQVLHKLHQRQLAQEDRVQGTSVDLPTDLQLDDCGWVANRWCELLPIPIPLKQQLLELESPLVRLELVGDVLERTGIAF
ncbi:LON peptidase substrate-binding domain-containing protein [Comamonas terrigena]|uniref:LON peptidase substrate-binding domain-containing protein n=1 Tax=Comamonas terrigena TaxID=32013 RepID=UPI0024488916|nr:LON peptidase substrate-binding domain-containing protein [Comamonas terrigena]MDH1704048.1 LON peptidase substrate-binding domain-containing protein [Comamonas terrigena]